MDELECARCGAAFDLQEDHTEIVRRDFRGGPRPSTVEHLCEGCLRTYVVEFLGEDRPA